MRYIAYVFCLLTPQNNGAKIIQLVIDSLPNLFWLPSYDHLLHGERSANFDNIFIDLSVSFVQFSIPI
ncbi:MAG: hypothetical protein AAGK47_10390 [Bacteroidota bacterium]